MADNLQFPIQPVPQPEQTKPFQLPAIPDPTALISQIAQLQERKNENKQRHFENLVKSIEVFAGLGERAERIKDEREQSKAVLELKQRDEVRKDEELELAKRRQNVLEKSAGLKPIPPEAGRFVGFIDRGLEAVNQMRDLIKTNPDIVKKATGLETVKHLPIIGGPLGPLTEAQIGGSAAQVFNNLNQELMDPEIRIKTGAALNREEWDFYKTFILKFFDKPETIDFKLNRLNDLFTKVKTQLQSGTRTPGVTPGDASTDSSLEKEFKNLSNPTTPKLKENKISQFPPGKKSARNRLLELTQQGYPPAMVDAILEQELINGQISPQ